MKALLPIIILIGCLHGRIRLRKGGARHMRPRLRVSVPRYLIPIKKDHGKEDPREMKEDRPDVLELDGGPTPERQLFLLTDHKVNKQRFNQRMGCKGYFYWWDIGILIGREWWSGGYHLKLYSLWEIYDGSIPSLIKFINNKEVLFIV